MGAECTSVLHPDILRDAENGLQESGRVQEKEVPSSSSALGEEQLHALEQCWNPSGWKRAQQKKTWRSCWKKRWTNQQQMLAFVSGYIRKLFPAGQEKWLFPSTQHWLRAHLKCCTQFWAPQYKKNVDLEWVQGKAMKIKGLKNQPCWISWDCSSWWRRGGKETYQIF